MVYTSLSWILNVLLVLLTVAFFTLFERKVMGLVHNRWGPTKVTFVGLLQPLLDAFKLLSKQSLVSVRSNKFMYSLAPHMSLFFSICLWMLVPMYFAVYSISSSLLVFMFIGSLMVFSNLLGGWASNSKYTFIGSLRSVAQSVSYEAVMTTLAISLAVLCGSFSLHSLGLAIGLFGLLFVPFWFIATLAESHRAPFDFSESESELVSGYNTEFGGAYFAYVFLGEYCSLLFSCSLIAWLFFPVSTSVFLHCAITLLVAFVFIVVRVSFCRFRYDLLMMLAWKSLLPCSLVLLLGVYWFV